ncbi:hypothetical protein CPC08DRAFT_712988 [Agrocybe pediades]|nr:hypothetical protein CPC08DRAFT_712988 [Agrocybe pediades]
MYNTNHWDLEEDLRDFDRTSTFCKTVGGTATFNFTGPATISVFGIIQPASFQASGRSSYTIDGGTPKIYVPSADHEIHLFDIQFFSTPVFDAGPHMLVITTLDDNNHFVYLDYIQIIPKVDTSSSVALSSVIIVNPFFTGLPTFTAIEATTTTTILPIGGPGSTSGTADTAAISASNFSGTFSTTSADTSITPTGTSTKAPTEEPTEAPTAMAILPTLLHRP